MYRFYIIAAFILFPFFIFAQSENGLSFDNSDDFVSAPSASPLIANSNAMSITFWVLPQNTAPVYPDLDGFAGFRNNTDADFYILQLSANGIEARFRNSVGTPYDISYNGLILNTAQHFTLTYDGSMLVLYHNGLNVGSTAASGTISNLSESFYIGMLPWTGANFFMNGRMDEISLWDKALSPTEINCIYTGAIDPSDSNLQLYYKCNQGIASGNNSGVLNLTDAKGNINGLFSGFAMNGTVSNFVNGVTTANASTISASLCPGGSYIFGSQTITVPGTYFETFAGAGTCDSIVQLILTSPTINTTVSQSGPILTSQQTGANYQWIDCLNGNTPIVGDTNMVFTATMNGQYAVVVTLGGCSDTSNCINVTNVGFYEINNLQLQVSPNPFSNELVIENINSISKLKLVVTDLAGRQIEYPEVSNGTLLRISTANWPAGIYFITDFENGTRVKCLKY